MGPGGEPDCPMPGNAPTRHPRGPVDGHNLVSWRFGLKLVWLAGLVAAVWQLYPRYTTAVLFAGGGASVVGLCLWLAILNAVSKPTVRERNRRALADYERGPSVKRYRGSSFEEQYIAAGLFIMLRQLYEAFPAFSRWLGTSALTVGVAVFAIAFGQWRW